MNKINEQLKAINVHLSIIDSKTQLINARLDELIAALHEYDDESYGESSFEAFKDEEAANKRMDIIGQNSNEGSHYIDINGNEFSDYGQRIAKEVMSNENNIRVDKDKSNNIQPKQKQYWKNNRSKRNDNKK